MTNREVARILGRIADILQIKDENPFKVKAYRNAADAVYHLNEDIKVMHQNGRLREIPGVGKSVQAGIEELMEKGTMEYYERLLQEVPAGVLDMLTLPGVGHKTIKIIYEQLGITSLGDLEKAALEQKIRKLPGLGAKSEYNIIKGLEMLKSTSERATLGLARPMAQALADYIRQSGAAEQTSIVGSIRRGNPLVGDIDILVTAKDMAHLLSAVERYPGLKQIESSTEQNIRGKLRWNLGFEIIRVSPEDYAAALVWTTGSKSFREALLPDGSLLPFKGMDCEAQVFAKLGLPDIPPELRENRGELEAAREGRLPELIEMEDIRGDLHVHSRWSDGAADLADMAASALKLGYSYLAVTDHSKSLTISGGLSAERLSAQGKAIDALNMNLQGFTILKGVEVDILRDGRLDYSDEVLESLDLVIASIHSHFKLDREAQTKRIIAAINNPRVNIIGHLSGRLLNRRPGYELDIEQVLAAAARNKVALEINSHPDRLDADEEVVRRAREMGIKIAINSDAHDENDLTAIEYGVTAGRRAWLEKEDVINCWDLHRLMVFLRKA